MKNIEWYMQKNITFTYVQELETEVNKLYT